MRVRQKGANSDFINSAELKISDETLFTYPLKISTFSNCQSLPKLVRSYQLRHKRYKACTIPICENAMAPGQ